jgi:peptidoglycan/LPS O-acetylase OafA/YrhL
MNTRNFGLDFLRAIAIFLVMWGHGLDFLRCYSLPPWVFYKPFDGVDLFFVLSGFLIGGLLLRELKQNTNSSFDAWWRFVARRWLRTIPAYWSILLLLYVCTLFQTHWATSEVDWLSYVFFYQNIHQPLIGFFWESWSLSVEEWFYLCAPLAIYALSKTLAYRKAYLTVAIAMIVCSFIQRHLHFNPLLDDFWFDVQFRKMVLMRFDGLGCGMLLAGFVHQNWMLANKRILFWIGLMILLSLSAIDIANTLYFKQVLYFLVVAIALSMALPYAMDFQPHNSWFIRCIRSIAIHSYGLYLVNLTLVSSILHDCGKRFTEVPNLIWFGLFWLLSWLFAMVLNRLIEQPFLRWRDQKLKG